MKRFKFHIKKLSWKERFDLCKDKDKGDISPFINWAIEYEMNRRKVPKRMLYIYY